MKFPLLLSEILRKPWAIDENSVIAYMPSLTNLVKGITQQDETNLKPYSFSSYNSDSDTTHAVLTDLDDLPKGSIGVFCIDGPMTRSGGFCSYALFLSFKQSTKLKLSTNLLLLLSKMQCQLAIK